MSTAPDYPRMVATGPIDWAMPPATTTKNPAAAAMPTNVAPLNVSVTTAGERNVSDRTVVRTYKKMRSDHASRVRAWRLTQWLGHPTDRMDSAGCELIAPSCRVDQTACPPPSDVASSCSRPSTASLRILSSLNFPRSTCPPSL